MSIKDIKLLTFDKEKRKILVDVNRDAKEARDLEPGLEFCEVELKLVESKAVADSGGTILTSDGCGSTEFRNEFRACNRRLKWNPLSRIESGEGSQVPIVPRLR